MSETRTLTYFTVRYVKPSHISVNLKGGDPCHTYFASLTRIDTIFFLFLEEIKSIVTMAKIQQAHILITSSYSAVHALPTYTIYDDMGKKSTQDSHISMTTYRGRDECECDCKAGNKIIRIKNKDISNTWSYYMLWLHSNHRTLNFVVEYIVILSFCECVCVCVGEFVCACLCSIH